MHVLFLAVVFLGLAYADGAIQQSIQVCSDACGACGGEGVALKTVCVCKVDRGEIERRKECLDQARRRIQLFNMDWRVEESRVTYFDDSRNFRIGGDLQRLRRVPRNPPSFYETPMFDQRGSRNFHAGFPPQQSIYEIALGNPNDDMVQLVIPQGDNIEVRHQYVFEDNRGKNHPCSQVISDMNAEFNAMDLGNTFNMPPSGYDNKFYDDSDESLNYPMNYGKTPQYSSNSRLGATNDWRNPTIATSNLGDSRTLFNQSPQNYNPTSFNNEHYTYEKDLSYSSSVEEDLNMYPEY